MLNKSNASFRRKMLMGVSAAAMTAVTSAAGAQEAADATDEVVVTGIRASLERSLDIKRNAKGVVDAISAEEMGKFPDSNLAESLQRVTGVSIDRERGEGSRVTVRGWGPEYNLVTLNGRFMPTSTLGDGASAPSTRSFDFANLAAEAVSGVEIYKTSKSAVPTGGIGSTINIKTTRPLDAPGLKATASVKMVSDTSRNSKDDGSLSLGGQGVTPEFTALLSNTFMDDRLGVSLTFSDQSRESSDFQATVGWRDAITQNEHTDAWGAIWRSNNSPSNWATNPPPGDNVYRIPQNMGYNLVDYDSERVNGQLTLQYDLTNDIRLTADYTMSEFEVTARGNDVSIWFDHNGPTGVWADTTSNPAKLVSYSEDWNPQYGASPSDLSMGASLTANQNENTSVGLNLAWDVNEKLSLELDYHDSSAESLPNSPYGSNNVIGTAAIGVRTQGINFENDLPVMSVVNWFDEPATEAAETPIDSFDPANRKITGTAFRYALFTNDTEQMQLNGSYQSDFTDFIDSVDFGLSSITQEIRSAYGFTQNDDWAGATSPENTPDSLFSPETLRDKFADVSGSEDMIEGFSRVNFEAAADFVVNDLGKCGDDNDCKPAVLDTDRLIEEETTSLYAQFNKDFELMDMPASVVVGLRYEETEVTSSAKVPNPDDDTARWVAANEFYWTADGTIFTTQTAEYDYTLPSVDFDIDFTDDIKFRASYSETIARPTWADMQGGTALGTLFRADLGSGSSGNPGLLPYESDNIDLSAEYYYGDVSYVSAGYYEKTVRNWISSNTVDRSSADIFGGDRHIPHPAQETSALYAEAVAAIGGDPDATAIRNWLAENRADNALVQIQTVDGATQDEAGNYFVHIYGDPNNDPDITWRVTQPTNSGDQEQTIDGIEVAWQHEFGDELSALGLDVSLDGFGLIANYTAVDGDATFDPTQHFQVSQFVLVGLSDSANLVGYYETDNFQARLAYNWRDEFISGYGGGHVSITEEYDQLDLHVDYDIPGSNINIFFDGINLTEEGKRVHGRDSSWVQFVAPGHARYYVGARYTF